MKVIFLDFDGVLNSLQECVYKRNRQEHSWYWRARESLANKLCVSYKKRKNGILDASCIRKDPFGILRRITDFSMNHVSDHSEFCPIACSNIQRLLTKNPDVKVVVSSTWRSAGVPRLKQIFRRNGIDASRIIDTTPYGHEDSAGAVLPPDAYMNRGTQIQKWLNHWKGETITHFVIIDDDSDMVHLMDKLVLTNGRHGFMWDDAVQVSKLLECQL